jgi:hypothetical protein
MEGKCPWSRKYPSYSNTPPSQMKPAHNITDQPRRASALLELKVNKRIALPSRGRNQKQHRPQHAPQ